MNSTKNDGMDIVKKFMQLSLIFGLLLVFLNPPFQAPDEDSHFKKAYVIGTGQWFTSVEDGVEGYYLPTQMIDYIAEQLKTSGDYDKTYHYSDILQLSKQPIDYSQQELTQFSTYKTDLCGHIIPGIGVFLQRVVFKLVGNTAPSFLSLLYAARIANLIFYICMISISIYLTPIMKKTFTMLGLMPMSLYLAASASYDALMISLAFLVSAMIFKLAYSEERQEITLYQAVVFGISAYIFLKIKAVYLPILILLFILPKHIWSNKKKLLYRVIIMCGVTIGLLVLSKIPNLFLESIAAGSNPNVAEQTKFVMTHPFSYLNILLHNIWGQAGFYLGSTFGEFGLLDTEMYQVMTIFYGIALLLVLFCESAIQNVKIKIIDKVAGFLVAMAAIFGVFLAMYLMWTSIMDGYGVRSEIIIGVQGRYFIPVMPALFLVFVNKGIFLKHEKLMKIGEFVTEGATSISLSMLCVSCFVILTRFWIG